MTSVEPSATELGDVLAELRALRATVDRQQSEIEQLRIAPPVRRAAAATVRPEPSSPVNRRAMLGLAGAGVAGVALVGGASSAAAAPSIGNGQPVETGGVNVANTTTEVNVVPTGTPTGTPGEPGFNALLGRTGAGNGSHSILGSTAGTGHAIAGVTPNLTNVVATTWGRGGHLGPAVEGEQINTTGIALAGEGNAVKGIIFTGTKATPSPSPNHSHAVLGITTGGGHAVAGQTPANAASHDNTGSNKVASTWGKHNGQGPGVEGEQNTDETIALAGGANAVKGIIFKGAKSSPQPSDNHSHASLGITYGGGHAVAGETPATAKSHNNDGGSNLVASTWGKHSGRGPGVEGEQNTTETVALAGGANAVKGIIFNGPKSTPTGSPNGSHAVLGITYGAGHSIAGDTPATAVGPNGTGVNTVAATWGRHQGTGAGIGGISVGGYGGEFVGGLAPLHLTPAGTAGAPAAGTHKVGELYVDSAGDLYFCTAAGTPGTFTRLNGQTSGANLILLPTPQRAYDSRPGMAPTTGPKTKTAIGETREVDLTTNTDLPADALGAMVNVTVTRTVGTGYLSLFSGPTPPSVMFSSINWAGTDMSLANQITTKLVDGVVKVYAAQATHFIIDVVGYYEGMATV